MDRMPVECFPVGEYLRDEIEARGWTYEYVADKLKLTVEELLYLFDAPHSINGLILARIGRLCGTGPDLWVNLDKAYQEWRKWKTTPPQEHTS